jgi:DNA-directed RNA polymerase subunit M/transcription elongation factor TFIIS
MTRKIATEKITEELKKYNFKDITPEDFAEIIEDEIYKISNIEKTNEIGNITTQNKERIYESNIRSFLINLAQNSVKNDDIEKILIDFYEDDTKELPLGFGLNESRWKSIKDKFIKRQKESEEDKTFYSTIIKCKKCGKFKVTYIVKQMAAADEAESIIFKCSECGTQWKK